jgi:amino acid transporter/nucleotide-binding universal stress UspA family protein
MLVTQKRPRVLKWYHAGPLLFGDWGTSRLYVLGLAFYYTGHASPLFLAAMSVIMVAVAWAYTVVCRCFPDGGGVYAAARNLSPTLSVIGATLLLCDYIVTAALSAVEGYHYLGVHSPGVVVIACAATIGVIGVVNWLGARNAGRFALIVAVAAIVMSAIVGILSIPLVGPGLARTTTGDPSISSWWTRWESLVRIVLALSGVEAVANMTGLMTPPVAKTAKRTIWPVLAEVLILNMVFGLAINALPETSGVTTPAYVVHELEGKVAPENVPTDVKAYRDTAIKLLAGHATENAFGAAAGRSMEVVAGVIFGLLLLSAVNTAVMAKVSVMYAMAHDKELPRILTRLNYSGVPWVGLIVACILPCLLLVVSADAKSLGELYAIGVVGAIAINVLSCAATRSLPIKPWERRLLWGLGGLMTIIELTIVIAKPNATVFAVVLIGAVLATRGAIRTRDRRRAELPLPVPATGWLSEIEREPAEIGPGRPRIMLAARGRQQAEFAVDLARRRGAVLFAIYVRTLRLIDMAPGAVPRVQDDPQALEALGTVAVLSRERGVPFVPIYVSSPTIAEEILDYTVTYGCDTLIMGKSARRAFWRRVEGDVIVEVAKNLPSEVALIMRDPSPYATESHQPVTPDSHHGET